MALCKERLIVGTRVLASRHGRDDRRLSCVQERFDHPLVGIEGSVGQESIGLHLRQQNVGTVEVVGLARRQQKGERIAQGIDQGVDFCAQSAAAAPDRFVDLAVFLGAPVAC
jgi:hypothetical protein